MPKKLKLTACVVGAGFIAPTHVEALRRLGIEVRALVGDGLEEAAAVAAALGIPQAFGTIDEALETSGADVYHLAVPNVLHAPYARRVLEAGHHVICEKPLALTSAESAELAALAARSRKVAAVSYNLRFYPMAREAKERIAAGGLGKVHGVHGTYLQDWLLYDTDWNWRLDPEKGGALRAVSDIGTHWLDLVSWAAGLTVTQVFAQFSVVHPVRRRSPGGAQQTYSFGTKRDSPDTEDVRVKTEDQAAILARFDNGALGSLFVSQVSAGRKNALSFQIDGSAGSLSWNSEEPNRLWLGHRDRPNEILDKVPALLTAPAAALAQYPGGHQEGYPDTFRQFFRSVYSYIADGDFTAPRDFPTFEDGHHEMTSCDAILKSAGTGVWVDLAPVHAF
jgi:predicted dehydrogenase